MTPAWRGNRRSHFLGGTLLGALLLGASPAYAHNVVEDRTPAPDSSVTDSPVTISLTTNDIFLDLSGEATGFGVVVRDSAGLYYGDGCVDLDERQMSASAELGQAGTYEIIYQFVSADGHSLSESYSFVFEPGPSHTPVRGYDTPAECGVSRDTAAEDSASGAEPTPTESAPPADEDTRAEDSPNNVMLTVGLVSLVSIAAVVLILWRLRQRGDAT
ncbi:MAG TPA: copper resistance protein CopC [Pontimonas sp.]|nr:copper resistance protein CopC [Pontimonas sp.]